MKVRAGSSLLDTAVAASAAATMLRIVVVLQTILVARSLGPVAVGILGISSLYVTLVSMTTWIFETASLTGSSEADEAYAEMAFRFRLGSSALAVAVGLVVVAFAVESPTLRTCLGLQMWLPLVESMSARSRVFLQRHLELDRLTRANLVTGLGQFVFSCAAVLLGFGILSLVLVQVLSAGLLALLLKRAAHGALDVRPTVALRREVARSSLRIAAAVLPQTLAARIDSLVVAHSLGPGALAVYSLSLGASRLPVQVIEGVSSTVLLPTLARAAAAGSQDVQAARAMYVGNLLAPLASAATWFFAPLTLRILDSRWIEVVSCLRIMAAGFLIVPSIYIFGTMLVAAGKPHLQAVASLLGIAWKVAAIPVMTARWGLRGAAWVEVGSLTLYAVTLGLLCFRHRLWVPLRVVIDTARSVLLILIAGVLGNAVASAAPGPLTGVAFGFAVAVSTFLVLATLTGSRMLLAEVASSIFRVAVPSAGPRPSR